MHKKLKKLYQYVEVNSNEMLLTIVAQMVYLLQGLLQNKIFTNFFSVAVFGEWSLLLSVYTLISMMPFSAFDQGILKVAHKYQEKDKERDFYTAISIVYIAGFFIYFFVFMVGKFIFGGEIFASRYLAWFLVYSFTEIYKNTFIFIDNAYRNRKRVFIIRISEFLCRITMMFYLQIMGIFTIESVLVLFICSNFLAYYFQRSLLMHVCITISWPNLKKIWKEIIPFSLPLLTWAIFGWMQNMISRWYLKGFLDYESVAMYSVLTSISYFVPNAVYSIVNAYVMPIAYSRSKGFNRKRLLQYLGVIVGVLSVYLLLIIFIGKNLLLLFTSRQYLAIYKYLPFTTLSSIIYIVAMLSTVEIYRSGKTEKLLVSTILPGTLMATIGYVLISKMGFAGAVINYMMGHYIYALFTFFIVFNKKNLHN